MALTNYLTQTMWICLIIFNGFGFYGKVAIGVRNCFNDCNFYLQTSLVIIG
ncbi:DUF418 domain-containing protein [Anaerobacillus sp. HL2]|nr:DUF418 domain-containing protein [Anaerobacillus sp. HL2]